MVCMLFLFMGAVWGFEGALWFACYSFSWVLFGEDKLFNQIKSNTFLLFIIIQCINIKTFFNL